MSSRVHLRPLLFIVTGPSGSGKGTFIAAMSEAFADLRHVPTFTTRPQRPSEVAGRDYNFLTTEDFERRVQEGSIFEYTRTYKDHYYGSPSLLLETGEPGPLLVELDYKGMHRLRLASNRTVVSIFVLPPSRAVAEQRILQRHREGNMLSRLSNYDEQIQHAWAYDYVLENVEREAFVADGIAIVAAELSRARGKATLLERSTEMDHTMQAAAPAKRETAAGG